MKKLLLSLSAFALLTACGGESVTVACTNQYWDGAVGTCLPAGWHVVERADLDLRGVPPEVSVAFQADQPFSGQFATVTVTKELLTAQLTPSSYSDASVQSVSGIAGYTKVDLKKIKVNGQDASLHIFTAQPQSDQPKTRFYQLSTLSGLTGYTFTAATPVAVDTTLEKQVLLILNNVTLVDPGTRE